MKINEVTATPIMEFLTGLSFMKDLAEVEKSKTKKR